ncbi:probable CCR4-associated factor 1 homolog 9 [Miscanthus floridulus]|uniref:probable CCR4-associated factor 1 homolog 9 n=1 Tax=Miscanthus floridulus TaxID=154761 RepID=UPI00345A9FB9
MVSTNVAAPAMSPIAPRPLPPPRVFQPSPPLAPHPAVRHAVAPPLVEDLVGFQIRPVTAANMESEMDAIDSLQTTYPIITIDTEYAGAVHRPSAASLAPRERYALVKSNVDEGAHRAARDVRSQGIDLDPARASGVSSAAFAAKLAAVLLATPQRGQLTWVAFGGAYDFAYVVKMLTGAQAKVVLGGG